MKKMMISMILSAICLTGIFANENMTQTIRGTVVDAVTGYPLIGATVILLDYEPLTGTITDLNGEFRLNNISLGRRSIEVRYIGYYSRIISNLLLTSGKEVVLQIKLEEQAIDIDEIVVMAEKRKDAARNEMAAVSARTFSVEETERFAGSLGDPARMVANYAGVMTHNDSRNDIIIRGNSPVGVLWRLEGVEVPNPNHFGALGTTGGPVSMINNNLLTNSDFLTGAFPAEFGNATAGVFDLNMRSGNNQKLEFTGQVGFNGFEAGMEGPFMTLQNGRKASYLANFRYSTLAVMDKLGFSLGTGEAIPQYKDLTFLVDLPTSRLGRLKMFGLLGNSYIELGREETDTLENAYNARGTATNFGSGLGVIGLSDIYYFNEKTRLKTTLSCQRTYSKTKLDSLSKNGSGAVPYIRSNQGENKLSFSTQFRQKVNARNNYSLGMIIDYYHINYIDSINHSDYGRFITYNNISGNMMLYRAYGQWQHKFDEKLTAYSGIHFQHFGLTNEWSAELRLSLKWQFAAKQSLSLGYGLHSQIQPKAVYFVETYDPETGVYHRTNENVKATKSHHFVLGYDYLINKDFRVKAETYYQNLNNVPVIASSPGFSLVNAGDFFGIPLEDSLVNEGTGTNYGLELTVEKFLGKGYYFLFTASVFDSKYKGYDGMSRNTAFNGNYVFNLLAGYEHNIGKHTMLTLDVKTVWAGGRRYVPVNIEESVRTGSEVRNWEMAYEYKYDDYFRTDFRIGIKRNGKRLTQEWGIDLQNITGYSSVFMKGFDVEAGETYTVYQQGFAPMFLYRIQF
jgi:hypothetical protein